MLLSYQRYGPVWVLSGIAVSISNSFEVSHRREKERKKEEDEEKSQRRGGEDED